MSRKTVYTHHNLTLIAILFLILIIVIFALLIGLIGTAFAKVGFNPATVAIILVATFLGSTVNIPIFKLKTTVPILKEEYVSFFGIVYRVPQVEYGERTTLVAMNLGGALIPTAISLYLLWKVPSAITYAIMAVAIVALVNHAVARPVKGVGITAPAFVSPIVAALVAYLLPFNTPQIIAYVAGVLGTLIGADLSNLHVIPKLGAPIASIGGAGTFDGVFLSGIIAALLA
jgi:uncharacterized membrane protein